MAYRPNAQSGPNLIKAILIGGFVLVAYMLYSLTVSIYESYQIDQHITNFETKNESLRQENLQKMEDFKYYTSPEYIDKIAKENFGLVNPGEEVIILTEGKTISFPEASEALALKERTMANWSNPKKWWTFVFEENPYRY